MRIFMFVIFSLFFAINGTKNTEGTEEKKATYITLTQNNSYSPTTCTPNQYKFTFILNKYQNEFKIHGIWPDVCNENPDCGYPSCCNTNSIVYSEPYDPTFFIPNKWYNTTTNEDCTHTSGVSLFKHEYFKHISCTNDMKNTTEFLNKAIFLYDKYYINYVYGTNNNNTKYTQLWLNLDEKYNYISTEYIK